MLIALLGLKLAITLGSAVWALKGYPQTRTETRGVDRAQDCYQAIGLWPPMEGDFEAEVIHKECQLRQMLIVVADIVRLGLAEPEDYYDIEVAAAIGGFDVERLRPCRPYTRYGYLPIQTGKGRT